MTTVDVSAETSEQASEQAHAQAHAHRTPEELEAFMSQLRAAPRDVGTLELVVRRPAPGEREVLDEGELDLELGLVGDSWPQRGSSRTADGGPHPEMQLNVMSARMVGFLAGDPARRALAGDQLYLDLDLSQDNLPVGSRLTFGDPGGLRRGHRGHRAPAHRLRQVRRALRGRGDALRQRHGGPADAAARAQRPGRRARAGAARRPGARHAPLTQRSGRPGGVWASSRAGGIQCSRTSHASVAVVSTEVAVVGERTRRGVWVTALVVAGVLVGQPALADDGLATGSRSRYVLDAKATTVEATMTIDLRNTTPNRGAQYYFFNAFSVPVPAGAEKVRARSGGSPLSVSLRDTDDPSTRLARISFPNLLYGRSRTITLTFEVPGEKPRAKDGTRVGPGYATFAVYGVGDEGRNTVEVVAPSGMTFEATSDDFTERVQGSTTTRTSTATSDQGGFWAVVSLRDPKRTDERVVDVAGVSLLLNGFQDDPKWGDFVARRVTTGIPALEKLVGTKWPGGLERIREDASPSLRGYDGWFDPSDDEIVIGEQLDADLLFHELAHAWVSGERFDERWVSEGLAQVLAERTVEATGGTPTTHPKVSRGSSGAVALNSWGGSAGSRSQDVDAYAYPASYAATRALVADLDDTQLAAVLGAALRGERAYDPAGTKDTDGGRTTWSRWLDLLQTRAGVKEAPQVFQRWVLTGEQRAQLAPREKARTAYVEVDAADGAWLPPEGLRDAMTAWDFERAATVREQVGGLGAAAASVQDAAQRAGLDVPSARARVLRERRAAGAVRRAGHLPAEGRHRDHRCGSGRGSGGAGPQPAERPRGHPPRRAGACRRGHRAARRR